MWAKFKASKIKRGGKEVKNTCKSLNVNEEYLNALRTKSFQDFSSKAQLLANESTSSCIPPKSFQLLEPCQEAILSIMESATFLSKTPQLKFLILTYFKVSAEASEICAHLLTNINQIQHNNQFMQQAFDSFDQLVSHDKVSPTISALNSFLILANPFSNPTKHDFELIHDKYSSILHHLKSKRRKLARKIMFTTFIHKASRVCLTAACGIIVIIGAVIASNTLAGLIMAPAILSLPERLSNNKGRFRFSRLIKCRLLRKIKDQLDVAAKGTYILDRYFDTMGRLVCRLRDEVERSKAMIEACKERRENKLWVEVAKELKKSNVGFKEQVKELEQHVCLCILTINRARALVIKEMTTSLTQ